MVGWSRRSRESDEEDRKYRAWFRSLSPERQAKIRAKQAESDRYAVRVCLALLGLWFGVIVFLLCSHDPKPALPSETPAERHRHLLP
jgi:hypothetical protein